MEKRAAKHDHHINQDISGKNLFLKFVSILEAGDTWSVDRFGRFFTSILGIGFVFLGLYHSKIWFAIMIILYLNQFITSFTNKCVFETFFLSLGLKQREDIYLAKKRNDDQ